MNLLYKPIDPRDYETKLTKPKKVGDLEVSFIYNINQLSGNISLHKKEIKSGVQIIGAKVTNISEKPQLINSTLITTLDKNNIDVISAREAYNYLTESQDFNASIYIPKTNLDKVKEVLLIPYMSNNKTQNMAYHSPSSSFRSMEHHAKMKLKGDLKHRNLIGRLVPPNTSIYGIIIIQTKRSIEIDVENSESQIDNFEYNNNKNDSTLVQKVEVHYLK